jgi:hypothetical protein
VTPYTGIELIAAQRAHQLAKRTADHDSKHSAGELVQAAETYIDLAVGGRGRLPRRWPWSDNYPRVNELTIERLAHAGALIAAEIDRLQAI